MVLSNDVLVVREASKTLASLAADPLLAQKLIDNKALHRVHSLLAEEKSAVQVCGLQILSNLAFASDFIARELFSETLLDRVITLIREGEREVQVMGLEAIGNLSFEPQNRRVVTRWARSLLAAYALGVEAGVEGAGGAEGGMRAGGRGLHSFTLELNLSTFGTQSWVKFGYVGHKHSSS